MAVIAKNRLLPQLHLGRTLPALIMRRLGHAGYLRMVLQDPHQFRTAITPIPDNTDRSAHLFNYSLQ